MTLPFFLKIKGKQGKADLAGGGSAGLAVV